MYIFRRERKRESVSFSSTLQRAKNSSPFIHSFVALLCNSFFFFFLFFTFNDVIIIVDPSRFESLDPAYKNLFIQKVYITSSSNSCTLNLHNVPNKRKFQSFPLPRAKASLTNFQKKSKKKIANKDYPSINRKSS